jgi:hypothetical protein
MKVCKYNNFEVRFISHNEKFEPKRKYDFAVFEDGVFDREKLFNSKNQLIFEANLYMQQLGNCEKYIIVENGVQLIFLWTNLRGKPEKINMRGGKKELFDYLFLTFTKKKSKCLYIGNSYEAPLAAWRNERNADVIYTEEPIVDKFLKNTVEQFLPFF